MFDIARWDDFDELVLDFGQVEVGLYVGWLASLPLLRWPWAAALVVLLLLAALAAFRPVLDTRADVQAVWCVQVAGCVCRWRDVCALAREFPLLTATVLLQLVSDYSDYYPPTKANPVRFQAGSLPDFRMWKSCWTIPLVGGFSLPSPCIPALRPNMKDERLRRMERLLLAVGQVELGWRMGWLAYITARSRPWLFLALLAALIAVCAVRGLAVHAFFVHLATCYPLLMLAFVLQVVRELRTISDQVTTRFSQVGIVLEDATGWWVFSGISRFPRLRIPLLLHSHLISTSSALRTSLLKSCPNLSSELNILGDSHTALFEQSCEEHRACGCFLTGIGPPLGTSEGKRLCEHSGTMATQVRRLTTTGSFSRWRTGDPHTLGWLGIIKYQSVDQLAGAQTPSSWASGTWVAQYEMALHLEQEAAQLSRRRGGSRGATVRIIAYLTAGYCRMLIVDVW
ncbi:hypothetical protein PR048_018652 [Dryococelus australis]|uniref:Uncharacterized protein n=1 Tax=Dryococelus australis TaxID=614101 RepID=A0ABQ9HD21_9NEOP|nr:hypothetical protein PR048_018652 [Dryococelus australis]